jgi:predicted site-specific integrase-resolvase
MSKLVDAQVLAKRYAVSVETVRKWTRQGVIPCIRPSRRIARYDIAEVETALKARAEGGVL